MKTRLQKGSSVIVVHGSLMCLPLLYSILFYTIYHKVIFYWETSILKTFIVTYSFFSNIMLNLAIYASNNNKIMISEHSSGPTFLLYKLIVLHMMMIIIII